MTDLRNALSRGLVLLDAGMGTRLIGRGLGFAADDDPCLWNYTHQSIVMGIHRRDVDAGAEALLTNTFGANRGWLTRRGWTGRPTLARINRKAYGLARIAAGPERFVIGDIGPTAADAGAVAEQAAALIKAGVDGLLFETHRLDQAETALDQLGRVNVPVLVSLLDWPDQPAEAVARLIERGAEAVGANCQDSMAQALSLAERLRAVTTLPLIVKPGIRRPASVKAWAEAVPRLRALAPVLAGGCCGTNEAHLAALRAAWYDRAHEEVQDPAPGSRSGSLPV